MVRRASRASRIGRWILAASVIVATISCSSQHEPSNVSDKTRSDEGQAPVLRSGPIYSEEDAIARAMDSFPRDRNPHNAIARLVTGADLGPALGLYGEPTGQDITNWSFWVVAILGDGLTHEEVYPPSFIFNSTTGQNQASQTQPSRSGQFQYDGIFTVFYARSGELYTWGGLVGTAGGNSMVRELMYGDIDQMVTLPLTVEPAPTEDPNWAWTVPTIDPLYTAPPVFYDPSYGPTPTSTP